MLLLAVCCGTWAQTANVGDNLWLEEFKGGTGATVFEATSTWSNSTNLHTTMLVSEDASSLTYTSSNAMANNGTASNMNGAHVWLNKNTTAYIMVSGIPLYNTTKVKISWAQAGASKVSVSYAFDGNSTFTELSSNSSASEQFESSELDVTGHTTINLKFQRTSTKTNVRIDNLKLQVTEVISSELTASDLSLANAPVSLNFDLYNNSSAQTISYTTSSTGAVTVSGGEGYVTTSVDETNKTITVTPTAVTPSAQTITVNQAADDDYNAGTATFTVSVTNSDPNVPGTQNNPYTVAQARAAIDAGVGVTGVYVTGIVCEGGSSLNSGAMNYWISDDGTETDKFEIYKGKGIDGANFTSTDDVQVGDVVVIYGNLKKYNSTYEFDANSQLVSLQRPEITTPSISLSETTIEATADETEGTINVTYTNFSDVIADVEFYEADGETTATYDWVTAQIDDNNNLYYLIEANEGAARTAYLKVYALDDDDNEGYSELITITQDAAPGFVDNYELFTGDLVEGDYLIVYNGKAMNTTVTKDRLQYDEVEATENVITTSNSNIVWHIAPSGDYWTIYNAAANAYAASTGTKNQAQMLADGTDDKALWTVSGTETYEFVNKQNAANSVNATLRKNGTYGFACYSTETGGALSLYKKVEATPEYVTVSISDAGYATYVAADNVSFPADVTAYIVSDVTASSIKLTEVLAVAKDVPVVVKATEGTYDLEVVSAEDCDDVTGNKLLVSDGTVSDNILVLANKSNGVGFYTWAGGNLPAGKVYLVNPNSSREFFGFDEGVATSISTIDNGQLTMDNAYNLQGQKVGSEYKGIVIVNGKKFINK